MRRLGMVTAAALMALSLFAQGNVARAGWQDVEWCYEDPIVVVFGAQFKIQTAVHSTSAGYAYTIDVPSNAAGRTTVAYPHGKNANTTVTVTYNGAAWNGSGAFSVGTSLLTNAADGAAVVVGVSGPTVATASYSGTANSPVSFSTTVTPQ